MRVISSLVCLILSASLMAGPSFNRMIVFGDSLSDNGNLYEYMNHQIPQSPPYFEGRFSNGPTWVELLAQEYAPESSKDFLLDYAFGGAGVYEGDDDQGMFTLRNEIKSYLAAHNDVADPDSLYVVWIGANNYLAIPDDAQAAAEEVTEGIRHGVKMLLDKGAKRFLIMNSPDLSITPIAHEFGELEKMKEYATEHNTRLSRVFDELKAEYGAVRWQYYDVEAVLNKVLEDTEQYGVTNVKDTCYEAVVDKGSRQPIFGFARGYIAGFDESACDGYLFFDPVHPTKIAHEVLAVEIKKLLDSPEVDRA